MTDTSPEKVAETVAALMVEHEAILRLAGVDLSDPEAMQYSDGKPVRKVKDITSPARKAADLLEALATRLAEVEAERDEAQGTYDELYREALADAKSDAQDFEGDLWKEVRAYIDELEFDWQGMEDGVPASDALAHIRDCMNGETARAEAAEAELARQRAEQEAAIGAVIEAAAKLCIECAAEAKKDNGTGWASHSWLMAAARAIQAEAPDATAALSRAQRQARNAGIEAAAQWCANQGWAGDIREAAEGIRALIEPEETP